MVDHETLENRCKHEPICPICNAFIDVRDTAQKSHYPPGNPHAIHL